MQTPQKSNGAQEVAASQTPHSESISKTSIPQALVAAVGHEARWMGWKITGANSENKEPMSPHGGHASSTNPATWADYSTARAFCERNGYALGLAITKLPQFTPLTCVDYDHVASKGAMPEGWAKESIVALDSYTERSASGEGFKAFLLGSIAESDISGKEIPPSPPTGKRKVEIFVGPKMVALTGQVLPGHVALREADPTIAATLCKQAKEGNFRRSLVIVATEYDAAKLARVLSGDLSDYSGDYSKAVGGACFMLAQKHRCDPDAMLAEADASPLCQGWVKGNDDKWDRRRLDEVTDAIDKVRPQVEQGEVALLSIADLRREVSKAPEPEIVAGLLPERGTHVMVGESTIGKTPLALQIGVSVANGVPFLKMPTKQKRVLLVDYENPRRSLLQMLESLEKHLKVGETSGEQLLILLGPTQAQVWAAVEQFEPGLVIVDALRQFDPKAETGSEYAAQLFNKLSTYSASWLLIHHPRKEPKDGDSKPVSLLNAPRVVDWLQVASGARALINQSMVRIGVEAIKDNRADLVMKWNVKADGDQGPVMVVRVLDEEGEPSGYAKAEGGDLLKPEYRAALNKLLAGRTATEAMRPAEVMEITGMGKRDAFRFIKDCEHAGTVAPQGKRHTPGRRYVFTAGENSSEMEFEAAVEKCYG